MIHFNDGYFRLETKDLTYAFYVLETKHLEHLYFGAKIKEEDVVHTHTKLKAKAGGMVDYLEEKNKDIPLDMMPLEYSSYGKGDFKLSPILLVMPDNTYVSDFIYDSHKITKGLIKSQTLPVGHASDDEATSLVVTLKDTKFDIFLDLIYTVFEDTNVISRRTVLRNESHEDIRVKKIMSMMFDIYGTDYGLLTLDGGWIKEGHRHQVNLSHGTYINQSISGSSGHRHNPGIIIYDKHTTEDYGSCYGINLIYSGNHYSAIDRSNHGLLRIMQGINPEMFEITLNHQSSFETPASIMSYSNQGFNVLSQYMHAFVENHIIPKKFKNELRPIAINSWEGFFFDFNERKLMKLARRAKNLGVELFVLDDGWFSNREDDTKGLGDYDVNLRKIPSGIKGLSKKIHQLGMKFGLWFEPEMININSKLYQEHPEYVVQIEGRTPSMGRHQLVLDLCQREVRDYIVNHVSAYIESCDLDYIKWDMNRHMSDFYSIAIKNQGSFFHTYTVGLYDVLRRIFNKHPHVLLETCSSGGNRFDLGMLSFGPQIWTSDNTDPISRLHIQKGMSYFYPPSTMSNHVSMSPHAQTLRKTSVDTRFHVAMFGILGYELDFNMLSRFELREIEKQIKYYKAYRKTLQYGKFYRYQDVEDQNMKFLSIGETLAFLGNYQILANASPDMEKLIIKGLNDNDHYEVTSREQQLELSQFGHLIAHALPVKLNPNKMLFRVLNKYKQLKQAQTSFEASGVLLKQGYKLKQQFMGTGYDEQIRLLSDFGSEVYKIQRITI